MYFGNRTLEFGAPMHQKAGLSNTHKQHFPKFQFDYINFIFNSIILIFGHLSLLAKPEYQPN